MVIWHWSMHYHDLPWNQVMNQMTQSAQTFNTGSYMTSTLQGSLLTASHTVIPASELSSSFCLILFWVTYKKPGRSILDIAKHWCHCFMLYSLRKHQVMTVVSGCYNHSSICNFHWKHHLCDWILNNLVYLCSSLDSFSIWKKKCVTFWFLSNMTGQQEL